MKKVILSSAFILGITAVGFSQNIHFSGRATLSQPDRNTLVIGCSGEGHCASIVKGDDDNIHLLVPDYNLDLTILSANINDRPMEVYPPEVPNGEYTISYVEAEGEE